MLKKITILLVILTSFSAYSISFKKKKYNMTTFQNVFKAGTFSLTHTYTCYKTMYDDKYSNGRYVRLNEYKLKDGDCESVGTHGLIPSPNAVEKVNSVRSLSFFGDGYKDERLAKKFQKKTRSRRKYLCRAKRVKAQASGHVANPCWFIYGLHGVCHNFSARLHKAANNGEFDFNKVKSTSGDIFKGGRVSRMVYGKYGARPGIRTIVNSARGLGYLSKALATKHKGNKKLTGLAAASVGGHIGSMVGVLASVSSLYHNFTTCRIYYGISCGI